LDLIFSGICAIDFEDDEDDDEWGHSTSAIVCLQKFALLLENEVIDPVTKFVAGKI
jgi:hypothetical protein